MIEADLIRQRLAQQRLTGQPLATPVEVVAWLGAVQSQEYLEALWSLGLRMNAARDEVIERAFNAGEILRTHVMRPTWHFVAPADLRWLLDLTGGRVQAGLKSRQRQLELDAHQLARSNDVIARALEGGRTLTRRELGAALEAAGISTAGQRLPHMLVHAELDGLIVSGPRRDKQVTYALLEERVRPAPRLARDEALAELVRRYFTSHGPATVRDFTWWSGLTVADAKAGLAAAGDALEQAEIGGQTVYFSAGRVPARDPAGTALLLPTFDEYLVGYAGFEKARWAGYAADQQAHFQQRAVIGGRVVASWRRTLRKNDVLVEIRPFIPLSGAETAALERAAAHYGEFLGLPAQVRVESEIPAS